MSLLKKILVVAVATLVCQVAFGQKIYSVKYQNQADVKVYVVKYENQADLNVYKVSYENQAGKNDGKWYFVKYENQADKKIYFVDYENQADLKVYFVKYENQAGWRDRSKMHLMYLLSLMKSIEVVAAIIVRDGKIFATQRGYGEWRDYWEFPGGKMEPGEKPEEALVREIREELATEIAVDRFVCTIEHDYPTFHLTMHNYLCHVVSGNLELLEHEAARWLSLDNLDSVQWLPADLKIFGPLRSIDIR